MSRAAQLSQKQQPQVEQCSTFSIGYSLPQQIQIFVFTVILSFAVAGIMRISEKSRKFAAYLLRCFFNRRRKPLISRRFYDKMKTRSLYPDIDIRKKGNNQAVAFCLSSVRSRSNGISRRREFIQSCGGGTARGRCAQGLRHVAGCFGGGRHGVRRGCPARREQRRGRGQRGVRRAVRQ